MIFKMPTIREQHFNKKNMPSLFYVTLSSIEKVSSGINCILFGSTKLHACIIILHTEKKCTNKTDRNINNIE